VCELRQREPPFALICPDLLGSDPPEQGQILLRDGAGMAPSSELTDLAMLVQQQLRSGLVSLYPDQRLDCRRRAVGSAADDAPVRRLPLDGGQERAKDLQHETLRLVDLTALVEQDRLVLEAASSGSALHLFDPIELDEKVVVFESGVQNERGPPAHDGRGEVDALLDFPAGETGEDRPDRAELYMSP
jgi:hypothetical protein